VKESVYKQYLLMVLLVILAFMYKDRLALGIVLEDIKVDLALSDTQLGVLSGIAFAAFYAVMGIPLARWADRGNRVTIITITTALWSAAMALSGVAATYLQLVLIRIGVAVGEAGCIPPAHSLIADSFTRAERPRAVARYMLGWPLSLVIGYFLAGWLNQHYGWRMTFVLLGMPGLLLASLAWFTLREPRLGKSMVDPAAPSPTEPSLKEVWVTLWTNTTFRHLLLCLSVAYFFGNGILQWQPAFFVRSYGLETGELGSWFALIWGVGSFLGTYWGGEVASRRAAHNEPLQLKATALLYCGCGVVSAGIYLSPNSYIAFALMGLSVVTISTMTGPLYATIQTIVPEGMRAMSIAIIYFFANLIGTGLGPLAAGALSDAFRPWAAEESLRYALLVLSPGYVWAGWHVWQGSKTVAEDVEAAQANRDRAGSDEDRVVRDRQPRRSRQRERSSS
jgi:predicted MFS family arabinose efflux permease